MTNPFKSVQNKTKAFLHSKQCKEALVFFCFVLLALGFWLLQSLQQEYEIGISIPIQYKNIPPDIAFTEAIPNEITARVKDKGSVLLNYSFGRIFAPIEVNMKEITTKKGNLSISRKMIEDDILRQLLATTTLISFEPQEIRTAYNQRKNKEVPAVFQGNIQPDAGFQLSGSITIKPLLVNIYASSEALDTIHEVKTVATDITHENTTITRTLQLQKIKGVTFSPEAVTVSIPIEEFTEKTLEIPVICLNIPEHYTVRTFPAVVKVTCRVPLSRFKTLSESEFSLHIPFSDLEQNLSGTLPITLSKKPDWVYTTTLTPDRIEFILEQNSPQ